MMNLPYTELHFMYYDYWLYLKEQSNKSEEEKGAEALQNAIEENT